MFERICVPPIEPEGTRFDLGMLAEALLFYEEVFVVVRSNNLNNLLQQAGADVLLELIRNYNLRVRYHDSMLGAITTNKGTPGALYDVGIIRKEGDDVEAVAQKAFVDATGKSGRGRRLASQFCRNVEQVKFAEEITKRITEDMQRGIFLEKFLQRRIRSYDAPKEHNNLPDIRYRFSLVPGGGFALDTNLDLENARGAFSELNNPTTVLAHYGSTVANMSIWADLATEVAVYPRQSDVIAARLEPMLEQYISGQACVSAFLDFVFDDATALSDVINSGTRTLKDLLPVLDHAARFRDSLSGAHISQDLVKEYHKAVTQDGWIAKLVRKPYRWLLFSLGSGAAGFKIDAAGGGGLGTLGAIALSAFDAFLVEKIAGGWKPHQFVERTLKDFVSL